MRTLQLTCLLLFSSFIHAMEWDWLENMRLAVQQQTYRGEFLYRKGDATQAYSIEHVFDGERSKELLKQLDGAQVEVIRDGNKLICYFPPGSEAAMAHPVPTAPFSMVGKFDLPKISAHYDAVLVGEERVAGFNARIIELSADEWRYTQRFWLEKSSYMLLQAELRDSDDQVLEQFRFIRLELAANLSVDQLVPSVGQDATVQSSIMTMDMSKLEQPYVAVNWLPNGFVLEHSNYQSTSEGWIETHVYSDGLASFSVFVEKNAQLTDFQSTIANMGATTAYMTMFDRISLSVVGELPSETARKIAQSVNVEASQ